MPKLHHPCIRGSLQYLSMCKKEAGRKEFHFLLLRQPIEANTRNSTDLPINTITLIITSEAGNISAHSTNSVCLWDHGQIYTCTFMRWPNGISVIPPKNPTFLLKPLFTLEIAWKFFLVRKFQTLPQGGIWKQLVSLPTPTHCLNLTLTAQGQVQFSDTFFKYQLPCGVQSWPETKLSPKLAMHVGLVSAANSNWNCVWRVENTHALTSKATLLQETPSLYFLQHQVIHKGLACSLNAML